MKSTPERAPSMEVGSLFRHVAWDRLSSAEPLDELLTLPEVNDRAGTLVVTLLLVVEVIVVWMIAWK
jgi:hypothetical protein